MFRVVLRDTSTRLPGLMESETESLTGDAADEVCSALPLICAIMITGLTLRHQGLQSGYLENVLG